MNPAYPDSSLPGPSALHALSHRSPRTGAADRLAQRLGLWLLLWGTRPAGAPWSEPHRQTRAVVRALRAERAEHLAAAHRAEFHGRGAHRLM